MFVSATASNLQSGIISLITLKMPLSQAHTNNVFSTSCMYNNTSPAYLDMGLCTQSVRKGLGSKKAQILGTYYKDLNTAQALKSWRVVPPNIGLPLHLYR